MSEPALRFEALGGSVVELDAEALGSLAAGESADSPWELAAAPDWERFDSLRLLAATFADGSITALVAIRPSGSPGHDADQVTAVFVDGAEKVETAHEALLSTEIDAEGLVRRVGVELWSSEEPPPRRLAADRAHSISSEAGGIEREAVLMEARLDGQAGTALFEVLRPV